MSPAFPPRPPANPRLPGLGRPPALAEGLNVCPVFLALPNRARFALELLPPALLVILFVPLVRLPLLRPPLFLHFSAILPPAQPVATSPS